MHFDYIFCLLQNLKNMSTFFTTTKIYIYIYIYLWFVFRHNHFLRALIAMTTKQTYPIRSDTLRSDPIRTSYYSDRIGSNRIGSDFPILSDRFFRYEWIGFLVHNQNVNFARDVFACLMHNTNTRH